MTTPDNPDRQALEQFMANGGQPAATTSSPLLAALACQIQAAEKGRVCLSFAPTESFVQGNGVVAGGIVATMLDFALAFAGLTTCIPGENAVSIGLNVCFLGPVKAGPVLVEASLVTAGYRVAHAEARLTCEGGRLLATATSALAIKRLPESK